MEFGYIDPASGSMILQIILGGAAAVAVVLKMWWRRFLRLLHIRRPEDEEEPQPTEQSAAVRETEAFDGVREPAGER
jgi:hypothetical protein